MSAKADPAAFGAGARSYTAPIFEQHCLVGRQFGVEVTRRDMTKSGSVRFAVERNALYFQGGHDVVFSRLRCGGYRHERTGYNSFSIVPANCELEGEFEGAASATNAEYTTVFLDKMILSLVYPQLDPARIEVRPYWGDPDPLILQLGLALRSEALSGGGYGALYSQHIAALLATRMHHFHSNFDSLRLRPARGGLAPWQLRNATEYMLARLGEDVALSEVAALCDLSLAHFARAFKHSFGVAPYRWLLEHRIKKAQALLMEPGQPIAQIALDCGFSGQSRFTEIFSRRVGMSPAAWRRDRRA